jgi:hypothetical protein
MLSDSRERYFSNPVFSIKKNPEHGIAIHTVSLAFLRRLGCASACASLFAKAYQMMKKSTF